MFAIYDGRKEFYQWDLNRKLIVDDKTIDQVHFCNKTYDSSLVCLVYEQDGKNVVDVPNVLLQENWRINVYGYDKDYTKHSEIFNIVPRTKPDNYVYTETEVLNYNTLLDRVNKIDENIGASVEDYMKKHPVEVDLSNYALKSEIPTNVSELTNDAGYLTEHQDLSSYALKTEIPDVSGFITEIPEEYITETELNAKGYLTEHQSLEGYAKITDIPDVSGYALKTEIPDVSGFITEIPTEYVTDSELAAKGYLTEHQSLEGYAKTTDIPDVSGYQTEAQVIALIQANMPASGDEVSY